MSTRTTLTSGWEPTAATPRLLPVAPGLAKTYMKLFVNRLHVIWEKCLRLFPGAFGKSSLVRFRVLLLGGGPSLRESQRAIHHGGTQDVSLGGSTAQHRMATLAQDRCRPAVRVLVPAGRLGQTIPLLALRYQKKDRETEPREQYQLFDSAPEVLELRDRLIQAFAEDGIVIPASAALLWTGSEADRLARCATPAGEWILGYGAFTNPWDYPPWTNPLGRTPAFIPGCGWSESDNAGSTSANVDAFEWFPLQLSGQSSAASLVDLVEAVKRVWRNVG